MNQNNQSQIIDNISNEDLSDFFTKNRDILILPIEVEKSADTFKVLYSRWNKYFKLIKETEWLSDSLSIIKSCSRFIKNAVTSYFSGDLLKANIAIKNLLKKMSNSQCICFLEDNYIDTEALHWFRARISDYTPLTSVDMKHIPFNKRSKITNQRYSINGIPCLYLGNSALVCWEELNRPTPDALWINRYMPVQAYQPVFKV